MRIGVNALQMKSAAGHSKAGLSRYAWCVLEAMMSLDSKHEFFVYVNQGFEVPAEWEGSPNFRFIKTRGKVGRMPHLWGTMASSWEVRAKKLDAFLSLAHTLPLFSRVPKVLVVHDLFSLTNPELYVERRARITANSLRRSVAVADLLIAVSEETKRELGKHLAVPPEKVVVTHLGPGNEVHRRDPASVWDGELRRIGVPFERYLFMLSTIEPRKNVPRLLEAFAKIAPEQPDLGLAIGGGKGWETSDIPQQLKALGIEERVKFLGYVADEDLPALFARCEAYVLPSLSEGFGITVLEAMLSGAPVVSSNAGALPEVGGDAVLYFDPRNVDEMADAIRARLRSDRDDAVRRGLEQAAKFDWRQTAEATVRAVERAARYS